MSSPKEQGEIPRARRGRARRDQADSSELPKASVNMDELRELIALLRENGLAELELENEGFRVRLRREGTAAEPVQFTEAPPSQSSAKPAAPAASGPSHPGTQASTAASQDQD